jgi:hypothetical protein
MKLSDVMPFFIRRIYAVLMLAGTSCLEPYNPPEITDSVDILVVDGFINSSDNSATVRLTKATPLSDISAEDPAVDGFVQIEDENGFFQTLNAVENGYYKLSQLQLSDNTKYRLSIERSNGKRYYSDFITLTACPPIDSLTWAASTQSEGINVFVNTHDDTGQSKYFQWTFDETWEYTSRYGSFYKLVNGVILPQDINVFRCWISKPSTQILIGSTTRLSTDIIRDFPLMFIPFRSQKVSVRYSILVQQRTLTKEAFDFWTQLKKSTESLGSLFDPLPSQVLGNMHSATDASEPVLGYFSGGQVTSKRLFIRFVELPPELRLPPLIPCSIDSLTFDAITRNPDTYLIAPYGTPFPIGFYRSLGRNCMDCRDEGGDIIKPAFWN